MTSRAAGVRYAARPVRCRAERIRRPPGRAEISQSSRGIVSGNERSVACPGESGDSPLAASAAVVDQLLAAAGTCLP